MNKKFLVVLKNPPSSFMVDGYENVKFFKQVKAVSFIQEGLRLWIPVSIDSSIAYISEMTGEEVMEMEERLKEQKEKAREMRAKLIKPKLKLPGRSN